ncbi:TPA: hypothetical protein ACX6SG_003706 [Photobacterium damselae]
MNPSLEHALITNIAEANLEPNHRALLTRAVQQIGLLVDHLSTEDALMLLTRNDVSFALALGQHLADIHNREQLALLQNMLKQ